MSEDPIIATSDSGWMNGIIVSERNGRVFYPAVERREIPDLVTDTMKGSGRPIVGALVQTYPSQSVKTDEQGHYRLEGLKSGVMHTICAPLYRASVRKCALGICV